MPLTVWTVNFYTASNFSGEAFLKICNAEYELVTNREHLEVAENLIRGGFSSVFAKPNFEASNKFLLTHETSAKQTFGLFIDANTFYGGIMEKNPLPLKNFVLKTQGEINLHEILSTADDSSIGSILEVDLRFPERLHDFHSDFPLASTKDEINFFWLGEYQRNTLESLRTIPFSTKKNKKLIHTSQNHLNIALSYFEIILWAGIWSQSFTECYNSTNQNGLNLRNNWTLRNGKPLSTSLRRIFTSWWVIRHSEKRWKVNEKDWLLAQMNKMWMKTYKLFNNDVAAITFKPLKMYWNKPTIVDATILDLSKRYMCGSTINIWKQILKP